MLLGIEDRLHEIVKVLRASFNADTSLLPGLESDESAFIAAAAASTASRASGLGSCAGGRRGRGRIFGATGIILDDILRQLRHDELGYGVEGILALDVAMTYMGNLLLHHGVEAQMVNHHVQHDEYDHHHHQGDAVASRAGPLRTTTITATVCRFSSGKNHSYCSSSARNGRRVEDSLRVVRES